MCTDTVLCLDVSELSMQSQLMIECECGELDCEDCEMKRGVYSRHVIDFHDTTAKLIHTTNVYGKVLSSRPSFEIIVGWDSSLGGFFIQAQDNRDEVTGRDRLFVDWGKPDVPLPDLSICRDALFKLHAEYGLLIWPPNPKLFHELEADRLEAERVKQEREQALRDEQERERERREERSNKTRAIKWPWGMGRGHNLI